MQSDQFYILGDPVNYLKNFSSKGVLKREILTVVVPTEELQSVRHKIERIDQQEKFKRRNKIQFDSLTKRECEILSLLARGLNNPQIGKELFISRRTVEQHHKNLNRKLKIQSVVGVMNYALAFDLI